MSNSGLRKVDVAGARDINLSPYFLVLAVVYRGGTTSRQPIAECKTEEEALSVCKAEVTRLETAIKAGGMFSYWVDNKHVMTIANVADIMNFQVGLVKGGHAQ